VSHTAVQHSIHANVDMQVRWALNDVRVYTRSK
jgi:hypothetical protein